MCFTRNAWIEYRLHACLCHAISRIRCPHILKSPIFSEHFHEFLTSHGTYKRDGRSAKKWKMFLYMGPSIMWKYVHTAPNNSAARELCRSCSPSNLASYRCSINYTLSRSKRIDSTLCGYASSSCATKGLAICSMPAVGTTSITEVPRHTCHTCKCKACDWMYVQMCKGAHAA